MSEASAQLGIMVVGIGFLGAQRAAAARASTCTRLVGLYDPDSRAAERVARRTGAIPFRSYDEGLACDAVDTVIVATPHALHTAQVEGALDAGKAVLCEKPLATSAEDAFRLAELANRRGLTLATGFNHRFYPPVHDALRLVKSGAIGRVESLCAQIGHRASVDFLSSWHADPALSGGGTLMDNGPHACDLISLFLGEVESAHGVVRTCLERDPRIDLDANAVFRGCNGGVAELRSSWVLEDGYLTLEIRGQQGFLCVETAPWRLTGRVASGRPLRRNYLRERVAERVFQRLYGCERSLLRELESFAAMVRSSRVSLCASGWDGCRATEMIAAVYESARTGRQQPLVGRSLGAHAGWREEAA